MKGWKLQLFGTHQGPFVCDEEWRSAEQWPDGRTKTPAEIRDDLRRTLEDLLDRLDGKRQRHQPNAVYSGADKSVIAT